MIILDANVIVTLCQKGALDRLAGLSGPWLVPEQVDDELTAAREKYPEQAKQYQEAKDKGLLQVVLMPLGSPAYTKFIRLRGSRTSPKRNRGEDACVALALTLQGSIVCTGDDSGANRARSELGHARVLTRADLLKQLGL